MSLRANTGGVLLKVRFISIYKSAQKRLHSEKSNPIGIFIFDANLQAGILSS